MLGSKHHVCESHTVLHMYTPESTPSALQQCAAPSYTLPRKPHNLIFIHISNYMYVFIYIYMSVCLCVCRVPPPWNLPFWYPPSSPSPEDFFRYPPQLHPRPSAADMPRSLALFSCSNPRLPFDLSRSAMLTLPHILKHATLETFGCFEHLRTLHPCYVRNSTWNTDS